MEELVAKSVEALASDKEALAKALSVKENQSLREKVAEILRKIADKVAEYFKGNKEKSLAAHNRQAQVFLDDVQALREMADIVSKGLDDAKANEKEFGSKESGVRFSFDDGNPWNRINSNSFQNHLIAYSDYREQILRKDSNNVIAKNIDDIIAFVDESFSHKTSKKRLHLGQVTKELQNRIYDKIENLPKGLLLFNKYREYSLEISQDDVRHLQDKKKGMSREIIIDYILNLPTIINSFDEVHYTVYEKGQNKSNALLFRKRMNDGLYFCLEIISGKKSEFQTHSIYIDTHDYVRKKKATSSMPMQKAHGKTPKTLDNSPSNQRITQSQKKIKLNTKLLQNTIIQNTNPMLDEYHTGIRGVEDIYTFEETLKNGDFEEGEDFDPDYTWSMAQTALKSGNIKVYSSYPIKQGVFVTPSKMEAMSYSGKGKIYEKTVNLDDVAWIDPTQGQYANVGEYEKTSDSGVYDDSNARHSIDDEIIFDEENDEWRSANGSVNYTYNDYGERYNQYSIKTIERLIAEGATKSDQSEATFMPCFPA